jgi:hypothetical protein
MAAIRTNDVAMSAALVDVLRPALRLDGRTVVAAWGKEGGGDSIPPAR